MVVTMNGSQDLSLEQIAELGQRMEQSLEIEILDADYPRIATELTNLQRAYFAQFKELVTKVFESYTSDPTIRRMVAQVGKALPLLTTHPGSREDRTHYWDGQHHTINLMPDGSLTRHVYVEEGGDEPFERGFITTTLDDAASNYAGKTRIGRGMPPLEKLEVQLKREVVQNVLGYIAAYKQRENQRVI